MIIIYMNEYLICRLAMHVIIKLVLLKISLSLSCHSSTLFIFGTLFYR